MSEWLIGALALALGGVLGWLQAQGAARRREQRLAAERDEARAGAGQAQARLEAWREGEADRRASEEAARKSLEDAFGNLSRQALSANSEEFLKQASERFDDRRKAIEALLTPFQERLRELDRHARELESKRVQAYSALSEQVKGLAQATETLRVHSQSLSVALKGSSSARGRWGETTLRNIAELSGMIEHCDFEEQVTTESGQRPDLLVRLPGGDRIPVDAKVSLAAYMEALETADETAREDCLRRHASDVLAHMRQLASRSYAEDVGGRVDFTVLFLPGDHFLAEAFRHQPGLFDEGVRKRVLIATPVTLLALLRTVSIYWRQDSMAADARHVYDAARELHERVVTFSGHLGRVRKGLADAVQGFNQAVGSYDRRVLPAGRKLEDLGAGDKAKSFLPEMKPLDHGLRALPEEEEKEAGA